MTAPSGHVAQPLIGIRGWRALIAVGLAVSGGRPTWTLGSSGLLPMERWFEVDFEQRDGIARVSGVQLSYD